MEVTYENIKSLIVSVEEEGTMIKLKFQAEGQETPLETIAVIVPDQDEIMKNVMKQAGKSAAANTGINMAANALGNVVGGAGEIATDAAARAAQSAVSSNLMSADKIMKTEITDKKKQDAIATAFGHLSMYYKWENDKWVYQQPTA